MLHINDVQKSLKVSVAVSKPMQKAIDLWSNMFMNKAPWLDDNTQSLGLPAAIAGEFARLITIELESTVEGRARAEFLQQEYAAFLKDLRIDVEMAAASGGVVFKPYVMGDHLAVEAVSADRFLPTAFNTRREITGAVFVERINRGKSWYTRMEHHFLEGGVYTIRNAAFVSLLENTLGAPCELSAVDEWAEMEPEVEIRYDDGSGLEGMLFSYFRIPIANIIDQTSPLGTSVYSRAVDLIKEADRQYSRILWEYEGSELAVDASYNALKVPEGDKMAELPKRKQRLFRQLMLAGPGASGDLYQVFSPAIRDTALFHGLDQLLKRIEFNCSLAYGTLSDPQNVDKTAEEIKTSKQRSYAAVCDMQGALQNALEHLVWVMDFYASLYNLAPKGEYEMSFTWGDGVLQDTDKDFATRKTLVDSGYLKPENLVAWYFGVSEEEARKDYMPPPSNELKLV